ncbi:NACHT domain-containing protein [Streptomyces sp. NBC_01304]|uniref:NACHT domain-containing protein n=1 Tax=Streptomyces sp. NBC_01304 TaxID=2903818 RepID=UPI002E1541EB|nr:NACHT domain-containing protein [Streptomyces sp. NBC_01304]
MDPAFLSGARLASRAAAPLIKKLFVADGPGAGLVDKPMRISGFVSFRGEKRTLSEKDLRRIAGRLVNAALRTRERPIAYEERQAVIDALTGTLFALGELGLTDVAAVRMGAGAFARELRAAAGTPERHLSADATYLYERLVEDACAHILNFFTQRSQFVARSHVEEIRLLGDSIAKIDELIARTPLPGALDAEFEARYFEYIEAKHSRLTIYGIDLADTPGKWPIDAAYLSLQAAEPDPKFFLSWRSHEGITQVFLPHTDGGAFAPRPADRALADYDRVLLRGVAGSGKTTLVQWLALSAARQDLADPADPMAYLDDRIPFVLPLRSLTRHGERLPSSPGSFLTAIGCGVRDDEPAGWAARVLRAGRGLLLVDGIDEVPEAERPRAKAWLAELVELYPGNRWLVTSRNSAVPTGWLAEEGFAELALTPMGAAETASFIGHWHRAAHTDDPEADGQLAAYERKLLQAVRAKPELGRLATNPLMCGLICALQRDRRGYLPHSRRELYEAALAMLLVRRDRERDIHVPEVSQESQVEVLQRLAYHLILNGRTELDRSRAESIIGKTLDSVPELRQAIGEAPAVYDHFLERSGLLTDPDPQTMIFIHRTFQDYLGARYAVSEGHFGVLGAHAADDQWQDVIRMAVGHGRPRERAEIFEELLRKADSSSDKAVRDRIHLVAAAALEQAVGGLSEDVRRRVTAGAESLVPPRDADAARALAGAGPIVLELLPGPEGLDEEAAAHVVTAASHVGDERAIPFLARYADHESLLVRRQLMWAWHRLPTVPYAEEVIARLSPDGLYFTVTTDQELRTLGTLGPRPLLEVRDDVTPGALAAFTASAQLTHVRFSWATHITDLSCLRDQTRLTAVTILPPLDRARPFSLTGLSADTPLRSLLVSFADLREGLQPIEHYRELRELEAVDNMPYSAADWRAVATLPHLRKLTIAAQDLPSARQLVLPGLSSLVMLGISFAVPDLRQLVEFCPALQSLTLDTYTRPVDLAPLAALPCLRELRLGNLSTTFTGLDQLPSTIQVVRD